MIEPMTIEKAINSLESEMIQAPFLARILQPVVDLLRKLQLKNRDHTCPMYNACSSLGFISEECSIKCFKETYQDKKDIISKKEHELLFLYQQKEIIQDKLDHHTAYNNFHIDEFKKVNADFLKKINELQIDIEVLKNAS